MQKRVFKGVAAALGVCALLAAGASGYVLADADALWHIVGEQCVPNQQRSGQPAPCAEVQPQAGVAVLKDRNGALQYLLIPTARVSGIESPALLGDGTPAYWAAAWQARRFMQAKFGQPIPRQAVSLTINSQYGRTQNQLHIHISCVDPTVQQEVEDLKDSLQPRWTLLPVELKGHAYLARRVDAAAGDRLAADPFRLLANEVAGAGQEMGRYGMALLATTFGDGEAGFVLLATRADPLALNRASAEALQDHDCSVLGRPPAP